MFIATTNVTTVSVFSVFCTFRITHHVNTYTRTPYTVHICYDDAMMMLYVFSIQRSAGGVCEYANGKGWIVQLLAYSGLMKKAVKNMSRRQSRNRSNKFNG